MGYCFHTVPLPPAHQRQPGLTCRPNAHLPAGHSAQVSLSPSESVSSTGDSVSVLCPTHWGQKRQAYRSPVPLLISSSDHTSHPGLQPKPASHLLLTLKPSAALQAFSLSWIASQETSSSPGIRGIFLKCKSDPIPGLWRWGAGSPGRGGLLSGPSSLMCPARILVT